MKQRVHDDESNNNFLLLLPRRSILHGVTHSRSSKTRDSGSKQSRQHQPNEQPPRPSNASVMKQFNNGNDCQFDDDGTGTTPYDDADTTSVAEPMIIIDDKEEDGGISLSR